MRSQSNYQNKGRKIFYLGFFFILVLLLLYFLLNLKINKFVFTGQVDYLDSDELKVLALNYLKDQSLFFYDKSNFETELKNNNPQLAKVSYRIKNQDTLEINFELNPICCVIVDLDQQKFLISGEGKVYKKINQSKNYNSEIFLDQKINLTSSLNPSSALKMNDLRKSLADEGITVNNFLLDSESINIKLSDNTLIIINDKMEVKNFISKYKNLSSYLKQNQKNYSIVDFRFEKVVVK